MTNARYPSLNRSAARACLLLAAALAGCASTKVNECAKLAGRGWTPLASPPSEAPQILARENLPPDRDQVWLSKGPDRVIVCTYADGLTVPGCGGSQAYEFVRKDGAWVSRGSLLDFCDTNPD